MSTVIPYGDIETQQIRLRQVLRWLLSAAILVTLAQGSAILAILPVTIFTWIGWTSQVVYTLLLAFAWILLNRGQVRSSIILINIAIFLISIVFVLTVPVVLPVLVLFPILAAILSVPYIQGPGVRLLSILVWIISIGIVLLGLYPFSFAIGPSPDERNLFNAVFVFSFSLTLGLILFLIWQFHYRLVETITQTKTANESLQEAQKGLEQQVATRTAELQAALRSVEQQAAEQAQLLQEIEQQRTVTRNLSIPILPVSDSMLVVPLIGDLDVKRLEDGQAKTLKTIEQTRARVLILDITGVPFIDSYIAQGLIRMIRAAQLLGAEVTVVGVRPEVAQAIIGLGLPLTDLRTASDLQSALAMNNHTKTEE